MKYRELKEPCKSLIANGQCLGCNKLELPFFESDVNCKQAKEIKVRTTRMRRK